MNRRSFIRSAMAAVALTCSEMKLSSADISVNCDNGLVVREFTSLHQIDCKASTWVFVDDLSDIPT